MARQAVHREDKPQGIDNLWNEIKQRKLGLKNIKLTKSRAYIPGMYRSIRNGYSFFSIVKYRLTTFEDTATLRSKIPDRRQLSIHASHIFLHIRKMQRFESGESKNRTGEV